MSERVYIRCMKPGQRGNQQRISLEPIDEEQIILHEDTDASRNQPREKIQPEDWSILDIFLPPAREHAEQTT